MEYLKTIYVINLKYSEYYKIHIVWVKYKNKTDYITKYCSYDTELEKFIKKKFF